jgi:hypothetical protein
MPRVAPAGKHLKAPLLLARVPTVWSLPVLIRILSNVSLSRRNGKTVVPRWYRAHAMAHSLKKSLWKSNHGRVYRWLISTALMKNYLRALQVGDKREFIRAIVEEVRVWDKTVQISSKLPLAPRTSPSAVKTSSKRAFLTLRKLVEAVGQCKEPLLQVSFRLPWCGA